MSPKPNPLKSQTIRVCPEVHRMAKSAAINKLVTLQTWVEDLIRKECKGK